MQNEKLICNSCGSTENVEFIPSRSYWIFGPYPGSSYFNTQPYIPGENLCQQCQERFFDKLNKIIS